ncbi:MAG TPA: tetratricopeptide repeat protein [Thiohalobacter sp.]|nr:tetratricopeptide repeat protein [Thiohalobacter sp.]
MSMIDNFEKMLASGQDSPLLRYSLGLEYGKAGDHVRATEHLRNAVEQDPGYSAAWKQLGAALADSGDTEGAISAYEKGIGAAEENGDKQAAKEMRVFLKRLQR